MNQVAQLKPSGLITSLAESASLNADEFRQTLMATVMPGNVTNEQVTAFLMVAHKYDLNPITKEIYAFPSRGGIQPIVSIDGWLKIINSHEQFDGMEFTDNTENGVLVSVTCKVFRKDRSHPTEVTEYMDECKDKSGKSDPWKRWPARMLRHKATIQAARYAFGLGGIYDPDEGERIADSQTAKPEPEQPVIEYYADDVFNENLPKWKAYIAKDGKTADDLINMVESKGKLFTDAQKQILED